MSFSIFIINLISNQSLRIAADYNVENKPSANIKI